MALAQDEACAAFCASLRVERAWRNVQPVLLASFEGVAQLLVAQAQQIRSLERELRGTQQLVDEQAEKWRAEARGMFVTKEDATAELAEFGAAVRDGIGQQLEDWKAAVEAEIQELRQNVQLTQLEATRELRGLREEQLETLKRAKQNEALRGDIDSVSRQLRCVEEKLSEQLAAWRQELTASAQSRPDREEIAKLLSHKLDSADARKLLTEKADSVQLEELSHQLAGKMRSAQETVAADLAQQLHELGSVKPLVSSTEQLKQNMDGLLSVVESLQHEVGEMRVATSQKLSVEDAEQLMESRTTLVGLENAVSQLESAFAADFVRRYDHASVVQQVNGIKQQLRSEMYQARYIWKEGRPSAKQTIAWSTQVVNTNADVFVWKAGSDRVMLKIPGLYHLQVAFFTDFTPTVQVLINGEPGLVLLGVDADDADDSVDTTKRLGSSSSNQRERHRSSRGATTDTIHRQGLKRVHHSAGNIVGLSIDAFLALPARAVVQIAYNIDEKAQGFLNLRKL